MSLFLGWWAYARDKNTSARLCAKKAGGGGGGLCARGGVFAGHYGGEIIITLSVTVMEDPLDYIMLL